MNDTQEIQAVLDAYGTALRTADVDLAVSQYAPDGVFYPYNLPTATGAADLRGSYRQIFETISLDVTFTVHEIVVAGDLAYATTTSNGAVTVLAEHVTVPEQNREVFIFDRTDDGWKIGRYMFNKSQGPVA